MITAPDTTTVARSGVPVYKRRRRRIYAGIGVAAAVVIALAARAASPGGGSGAPPPSFTIAYGQGTVANSDSIIDSHPALARTIPAQHRVVPFDAGATAIAALRAGSLRADSGVRARPVAR